MNKRNRTFLNIVIVFIMTVSLVVFYYFFTQTAFGIKYNTAKSKYDNIYVFNSLFYDYLDHVDSSRIDLENFIKSRKEVRWYTGIFNSENHTFWMPGGRNKYNYPLKSISEENIQNFTPQILQGKPVFRKTRVCERRNVLVEPAHFVVIDGKNDVVPDLYKDTLDVFYEYGAIVPRSLVDTFFGQKNVNVIGKDICWVDGHNVCAEKIICVYEDFPASSPLNNSVFLFRGDGNLQNRSYTYNYYVRLDKNVDIEAINDDLKAYNEKQFPYKERVFNYGVHNPNNYKKADGDSIVPVRTEKGDIVEDEIIVYKKLQKRDCDFSIDQAFKSYVYQIHDYSHWCKKGVSMVSLFYSLIVVLLGGLCVFAIVKAEIPSEMKSINIRLVIGTSKRELWLRQILKYFVLSVIAWFVAMVFVGYLSVSISMNNLVTDLSPANNWMVVFLSFGIAMAIGLFIGGYTAWYSTSKPMNVVLKGRVYMDVGSRTSRNIIYFIIVLLTTVVLWMFVASVPYDINIVDIKSIFNSLLYPGISNGTLIVFGTNYTEQLALTSKMKWLLLSSVLITMTTIFCLSWIERHYMARSRAIRKALGTTNYQLFQMEVKADAIYIAISLVIGALMGWALGELLDIDICTKRNGGVCGTMILITYIPKIINNFICKDESVSNAIKQE